MQTILENLNFIVSILDIFLFGAMVGFGVGLNIARNQSESNSNNS